MLGLEATDGLKDINRARTIALAVFVLIIILGVSDVLLMLRADSLSIDRQRSTAQLELDLVKQRVEALHQAHVTAVTALVSGLEAATALHSTSENSSSPHEPLKDHAASVFSAAIAWDSSIDHVRLLSTDGQELVRVNRSEVGTPLRVEQTYLQNKQSRDYFQKFMALELQQVGSSSLSLNEEFGQVQRPLTPVIRSGVKLQFGGQLVLLVVNFRIDTHTLVGTVSANDAESAPQVWLVDDKGYFIDGGQKFAKWEFDGQLGDGSNTVEVALADIWPQLYQNAHASLTLDGDEYVFVPVPLLGWQNLSLDSGQLDHAGLILFAPREYLAAGSMLGGQFSPLVLLGLLGSLLGALMLVILNWRANNALALHVGETEHARNMAVNSYGRLRDEEARRADLLAVVGHEIRSPLASLSMMASQSDAQWLDLREPAKSMLENTLKIVDELKFIAQPLDRPSEGLARTKLRDLIRDGLTMVATAISTNRIQVRWDLGEYQDFVVVTDVSRVTSMLSNLVRNACIHSHGHNIWVSGSINPSNGSEAPQGDTLLITVEDDGRGIPQKDVARVFEIFSRGDTHAAGSGIGLHLVKSWLEDIGGEVAYFDSPHGGAGFRMSVPLVAYGSSAELPTPTSDIKEDIDGLSLANKSVLVVDDDRMLLALTDSFLTELGAEVVRAMDGSDGLELASKRTFDLIITDYFMPELSGLGMIETLRESGYPGVIIGCTAATVGNEMNELLKGGADAVVSKPLSSHTLLTECLRLGVISRQTADETLPENNAHDETTIADPIEAFEGLEAVEAVVQLPSSEEAPGSDFSGIKKIAEMLDDPILTGRLVRTNITLFRSLSGGSTRGISQVSVELLHKLLGRLGALGLSAFSSDLRGYYEQVKQDPDSMASTRHTLVPIFSQISDFLEEFTITFPQLCAPGEGKTLVQLEEGERVEVASLVATLCDHLGEQSVVTARLESTLDGLYEVLAEPELAEVQLAMDINDRVQLQIAAQHLRERFGA